MHETDVETSFTCADSVRATSAGFSLVELVVVLGLMSVLLAFGYPRLARLSPVYRLDGAAWNLSTELQKIRLRAIQEGLCFQMTFDTSARTYQLKSKAGSTGCGGGTYAASGSARKIDDAGQVSVSATASPAFDPRGTSVTTSVVTLTSVTSATRLIAVQPTGRILVQ